MKNTLCSIVTALLITLIFTPNSLTQYLQREDSPDGKKTSIGKGKHRIYDMKYSPDGTRLAVAGEIGILLYDVRTNDEPVQLLGHTGIACKITFSPDGNLLASADSHGSIRLLDVKTGQLRQTIKGAPKMPVLCVTFSPDGRIIASGNRDHTVRLFDVDTGKLLRTFSGHTRPIHIIAYSPNGETIASISWEGVMRLWNVSSGVTLHTFMILEAFANKVEFSPDGRIIAAPNRHSNKSSICLWEVKTGRLLRTFGRMGHINSVAFSPDGRTIAGSNLLGIGLFDVNTGQPLRIFRERSSGVGTSLALFSPAGRTIAVCGSNEVDLWDAKTGKLLRKLKMPD